MCDFCSQIYRSSDKHDPSVCPIASALTCSCCNIRGHATLKCPNLISWNTRVPQYVEQLIPYELRIHHGIKSDQMTSIETPNLKPLVCKYKPTLEIPEDKDSVNYTANIRATLASHNLPVTSVKDNKKLVETLAAITGKKLILLKKDRFHKKDEPKQSDEDTIKKKPVYKIAKA